MKIINLIFLSVALFGCASGKYVSGLRTPVTNQPNHYEGHITGVGGLSLLEQSWLPESKNTKAIVIIVHGLKDHSSRYADAAIKLSQNDYAVYAYDHRGHGDSEGQRVWVDSFDDYVADLETYYDYVKAKAPDKPIYLFGHSMGGAIVTTFALQQRRQLAGIILSAPALKVTDDVGAFLIGSTKVIGTIMPTLAVFELKDEKFSRDPEVVNAMKNDPLVIQGNGPAKTAKELLKAIAYINEHMHELNVPFICLHGKKDVITNPEGSKELYQKAVAKDRAIKLYADTYHDLLHEPNKDVILKDIINWLNFHSGK